MKNTRILEEVNKLFVGDGVHSTILPQVKIFSTSKYDPMTPFIYDICLFLVLQGKKIGHLMDKSFTYDCNNYLVVPTTLPLECETYASKEEPFIGLTISIDKDMMNEIIECMPKKSLHVKEDLLGVFSDTLSDDIEDLTFRLLKALNSKTESKVLGKSLLRELYYRILLGENAEILYKMFSQDSNEARISKAIKAIHDNIEQPLDVESLSRYASMSVSSFHSHFKKITSHSPLQYMKKIRMAKAKSLLSQKHYQVNEVAEKLGYESPSKFSRDFKNYFGVSPVIMKDR